MSNYRKLMQIAVIVIIATTACVLVRTVFHSPLDQPIIMYRTFTLNQSVAANKELRDLDLRARQQEGNDNPLKEEEDDPYQNSTQYVFEGETTMSMLLDTIDNSSLPTIAAIELQPIGPQSVKQFVFTKIEKTGSSTFFAVLARYVHKNRLNILMPKKGVHIDWESRKGLGWDIGPAKDNQADVLLNHALYIKPMIDKYVRPGYQYIAMVREPVSWFKSATKYYFWKVARNTAEQVINNDKFLYLKRTNQNGGTTGLHSWFHLAQLQWMGFDYRQKGNMSAITEYVEWLTKQIDVVMIHEHYDPSLVVLRRRFHWSHTDIFYRRYIVTNSASVQLSAQATQKLLSAKVNLGDKLLYDKLNATFWKQPELSQENFWDEVKYFNDLNLQVSLKICPEVVRTQQTYVIPASKWVGEEQLTEQLCKTLLNKDYAGMMADLGNYALGAGYKY